MFATNLSKKKRIVLVIGAGWGVRTFLQTDVLPELKKQAEILILCAEGLLEGVKSIVPPEVQVQPLRPFDHQQGSYGFYYKRRNHYFLRMSSTKTRQIKRERFLQTFKDRGGNVFKETLYRLEAFFLANPKRYLNLTNCGKIIFFKEYPEVSYYTKLLNQFKPNLVVSTIAYAPLEAPPILSAQSLGLKTAAWINSWDNLTSKPPFFAFYDSYFVWSDPMRLELEKYYPEAKSQLISVTGVPHFDWYCSPALVETRENFCRRFHLDPNRPLIVYTTVNPYLAWEEHRTVLRLANELYRIHRKPQMIVRLHPGDRGRRWKNVQFPKDVRFQNPAERGKGQSTAFCPTDEENKEFVNTICHADILLNLASTTTLDAAFCNRPVINIAFDGSEDGRYQKQITSYYTHYDHFVTVVESGATRIARTYDELLQHIDTYLKHPELEQEQRRKISKFWCEFNDGKSGERLAQALLDCCPS